MSNDVPQRVYEWLARLHALTAGSSSTDEARERIELLAPVVADAFPVSVFTQGSLNGVSAKCRFWPTSGELVAALREWRETAAPVTLAITGTTRHGSLEGTDLHWFNYFHKREAEGFSPVNGRNSGREHVLSLVKDNSLPAWSKITGIIPRSLAPTEAEIAKVARALHEPDRAPRSAGLEPEPPPRPKTAYLTGDALRQSREARGLVVPEHLA